MSHAFKGRKAIRNSFMKNESTVWCWAGARINYHQTPLPSPTIPHPQLLLPCTLPETPFLLKTSTSFLHTVHRTCKTLIPKWPEAMYLHMIQQLVPSIEAFLSGSLAARVPAVESYMLWGMLVLVAFEICLSSERAAADGACMGVWCAR